MLRVHKTTESHPLAYSQVPKSLMVKVNSYAWLLVTSHVLVKLELNLLKKKNIQPLFKKNLKSLPLILVFSD